MSYVDLSYYLDTYGGDWPEHLTSEDFTKFETRASLVIDSLTSSNIQAQGFENLHPLVQQAIKNAVCAQIEYMLKNGTDALHGVQPGSVHIGNFSYQVSSPSNNGNNGISPEAILHLSSSGLLYQGVMVCD